MYSKPRIERFNENVKSKYEIYQNVFMTFPFDNVANIAVLLPLFSQICDDGFENENNPEEIVNKFFDKHYDKHSQKEKINLLFNYIQYIERQVVLFDAIEDAHFSLVNNMQGTNSIRAIKDKAETKILRDELATFFKTFQTRIVLTAHPTQFYPGPVLGIINDLIAAFKLDDLTEIKKLMAQLGKTPFINKQKPTPYDEALSLIWFLENVFYQVIGEMNEYVQKLIVKEKVFVNAFVKLGFWPGGDRDGNPFVTNKITLEVAQRLRTSILKCYYFDVRKLKRKLTFKGVSEIIFELEQKLYRSVFYSDGSIYITPDEFEQTINTIIETLEKNHQSLYVEDVIKLRNKFISFGFYFASLDIRQNSKIHQLVFEKLIEHKILLPEDYLLKADDEKLKLLENIDFSNIDINLNDENIENTLGSILAMQTIQSENGLNSCNRYIISNNESAAHVLETLCLFELAKWESPTVDIVPLFESIDDLQKAHFEMEKLYTNTKYHKHLAKRENKQTVMLGFSDGTKDGGYLMANWSIFQAKENITAMSEKYGIEVIFFDGRGGPPARGGGKTHKYYASQGKNISSNQIQLTVQGQTISSNFGTLDSCRFNLENLISAGAKNKIYNKNNNTLTEDEKILMQHLSDLSYEKYKNFKAHPQFLSYLEKLSPLPYYADANIGSRPAKRNKEGGIQFKDLRAIPFVGSWSQIKQNVPGFFGVGTALKFYEDNNNWQTVQDLYNNSVFFRTLLENSMMALCKSHFPLTAYLKKDPVFAEIWHIIHDEFKLTERLLLKISGDASLMANYPDGKASIDIREKIVRPLLVIQQYAIWKLNKGHLSEKEHDIYKKMLIRTLFGNINASRNSA
jgi:phosphoenolpyruvate carboxylase